MKKQTYLVYFLLTICSFMANAQQKKAVTLEDIWEKGTFRQATVQSVNWMKDGAFYTALHDGKIIKYQVTDGTVVETLFDETRFTDNAGKTLSIEDYSLSADEQKILLSTGGEQIYRRSSREENYVYDLKTKKLQQLSKGGKQMFATFSPDGSKIAFVRKNDLFMVDLATMTESAITKNGKWNEIINGACDWVYEEEFSFARAFQWAPDSKKIAFYTFDETNVPEYNMQVWGKLYPTDYRYKYPKAGEPNSIITISVFHLADNKTVKVDIGKETDIYIPRIRWTQNPNMLSLSRLNRLQNKVDLLHADVSTGKSDVVLTEESKTYVDVENFGDDFVYLADGKSFISSSERDGFKHLYQFDLSGKLIRQITTGNWEVDDFQGIDEKSKILYFTSTEVSSSERHLYSISLDGKNKKQLSTDKGLNRANFSKDFKYYILSNSAADSPLKVSLHKAPTGQLVKILEDNATLRKKLEEYNIAKKEFFTLKTADNIELSSWIIKPTDFDPNKKYPLLMFVYGGPGSQQVINQFDSSNFFWYQHLAQKGYIVACVDNRGTGGKGVEFKKCTYLNLGKLEVHDQIEAAKYFGALPYIDKTRIGIQGWSYGGFMSSNCLFQGCDYFKTAVAVAPVTNWRFYDSIYTERFQRTPQENAAGYDDNSPVTHAKKLKGNFLLVHGTGDDNVHFQNAVALEEALIKSGKQFQSFYYPNKNHGINGGNTRLHLYTMMTNFLEKNL
ncbi:dipeptidyl-peptidase-4 [Pseudarcicella hirudinis]|uniref:Dipeptidyl-peptidase-4 n=1 Tax=Pseudarcicella hirudinis TaxID=1079859 RepID=A0A1I5U9G8_9BACT|nr:S9 family peptidase [Pseudarcicella hirudinis]SFP91939.1 dipeptidyl-peptidase-4 [Pseudarcicella hirudinis]